MKLTKRSVESLSIRAKDYFVWDSEIAGFGVRVFVSGRKSYLVQYRASGRSRRKTIGRHGVLTADDPNRMKEVHKETHIAFLLRNILGTTVSYGSRQNTP
ncbi:Arm DNA-binding domain-containing protein [Ascidiaceihabitans sp.]|uniref:Arm DNA-binding domain-containing protein n=1 Tax=Ascidiaceihabitans sp. TaxID=1872644 RepID=UPI003298F6B4